jgi:ubiquitin-conjugating enzyme E2 variant
MDMIDGMARHPSAPLRQSERLSRSIQAAAILGTAALGAFHLGVLAVSLDTARALPIAAGLLLGALAADLITGVVHWACDTWGDESTPWIGESVIRSFHQHHVTPLAMLDHDWIDVNGQAAAAACLAFGAMALPPCEAWLASHPLLYAGGVSLGLVGALANQLHQWSHDPAPPKVVRRLQRRGWILSPARHARHHRAPHESDYCISSGWLNPPLDAIGFWRALERVVTQLSGVPPRAAVRRAGCRHAATR